MKKFNAVLLRSKVGGASLRIDDGFTIPSFARLRLGEANLQFLKQIDRRIFSDTWMITFAVRELLRSLSLL